MRKIIAVLFVLILSLPLNTAYAGYVMDSNGKYVLSEDSYTQDGKIKITSLLERYGNPDTIFNSEIEKFDQSISLLPGLIFGGADDRTVTGTVTYPNRKDVKMGNFDLQWLFTPDDPKYETRSGVFHFYIWPPDTEEQKGKLPESKPDEPTVPSLTATTVLLNKATSYDINLNNKVSGSSYSWTSSNESVATVDKKGMVRAKKEGKTTISCKITLPDASTQTLVSEVIVGYDDNAPLLTDTDIDLSIGDTFDINVENTIAKSKYRWATSNKSILKVNAANGKVAAISAGRVYVTCTITTPDRQIIVLRCDITVTE